MKKQKISKELFQYIEVLNKEIEFHKMRADTYQKLLLQKPKPKKKRKRS